MGMTNAPTLSTEEVIAILADNKKLEKPIVYNPEGSTTILVVADLNIFTNILESDLGISLNEIEDAKIVFFNNKYCHLGAYKYAKENHIDKAVINHTFQYISLPYMGEYYSFDGIALASAIKKYNPDVVNILYGTLPIDNLYTSNNSKGTIAVGVFRKIALELKDAMRNGSVRFYANVLSEHEKRRQQVRGLLLSMFNTENKKVKIA